MQVSWNFVIEVPSEIVQNHPKKLRLKTILLRFSGEIISCLPAYLSACCQASFWACDCILPTSLSQDKVVFLGCSDLTKKGLNLHNIYLASFLVLSTTPLGGKS